MNILWTSQLDCVCEGCGGVQAHKVYFILLDSRIHENIKASVFPFSQWQWCTDSPALNFTFYLAPE